MKIIMYFRMRNILIYAWLLICIYLPAGAQAPALSFNHLNMKDGLTSDNIRIIYQDREGYMWFGGQGATNKFDGKDYYDYSRQITDTSASYLQSTIGIIEDESHGLWFINDTSGLIYMKKGSEEMVRFKHNPSDPSSLSSNKLRFIFQDSRNNIWITTSDGGLNLYNTSDSSFYRFKNKEGDSQSPASNDLACIAEDSRGMLWISSPDGFLIKLDPSTRKFTNIRMSANQNNLSHLLVYPVLHIDGNNVWYGDGLDLCRYDQTTGKAEHIQFLSDNSTLTYDFISSILEFSESFLLITTYSNGLYLFNKKNGRRYHYTHNPANPSGICSDHLSGAYRSRDGDSGFQAMIMVSVHTAVRISGFIE